MGNSRLNAAVGDEVLRVWSKGVFVTVPEAKMGKLLALVQVVFVSTAGPLEHAPYSQITL